jgi:methyltransferase (TIGR00027 family)
MVNRRRFLGSLAALGLGPFCPLGAIALEAGEPSRTAQGAALHRAAHQLLERPLVFDDPLALQILGGQRVRWLANNLARYQTRSSRAMRAFLVTRSRYAEDELARVHQRGTRQYIVLGAGLDTFAYRNPYGKQLRVFEVDHPTTQKWKRVQLQDQGIELPRALNLVPVDFEKDSLADCLRRAGFRRNDPVFISWLGVTMYLTREAVMQTLGFVADSCAAGSEIVFDFSVPDDLLGEVERTLRAERAKQVAKIGEPWISHFEPASLVKELTAIGFSRASSLGAQEANQRYFADREDGFSVRGSGQIMTAYV